MDKKNLNENINKCNHEYIEYRNFDGHTTSSSYKCIKCFHLMYTMPTFKILERIYLY